MYTGQINKRKKNRTLGIWNSVSKVAHVNLFLLGYTRALQTNKRKHLLHRSTFLSFRLKLQNHNTMNFLQT